MLDVNHLHDVFEGKFSSRGCGKTTAMIVTALGYADFEGPDILILGNSYNHSSFLKQHLISIAREMDFEDIEVVRDDLVRVNRRFYHFYKGKSRERLLGNNYIYIYDHFVNQ